MPKNNQKTQRVDPNARNLPAGQEANPEQDNYDIFVSQGIMLAGPAADEMQDKASVDVIGNTLFDIVSKVENEGKKNGVEFSLAIVLNGANEILNHLIEMSGVQINEEQIKAVIGTAVGRYVQDKMKTGAWTPQQAQEMAQQAQGAAAGTSTSEGPVQPGTAIGPAQPGTAGVTGDIL